MRTASTAALPRPCASRLSRLASCVLVLALLSAPGRAAAQQKPFEPVVGQPGKDVVWVPTPPELVEKMLDMAEVTSRDVVMDLGSGDGRNIIAAAKRGARAIGVEYNDEMVALAQARAREAGVADRATFIKGDMYEADISQATVMALFLLPENLRRLRDKFLALPPGSRLVMNTFAIPDWEADLTETIQGDCVSWCTALLYYVPAKAAGTWKMPQGELTLTQEFQMVSGTMTSGGKSVAVRGKLRGDRLTLTAGGTEHVARVVGDRLEGKTLSGTRTGS